MKLEGKRVLITGGSAGLGAAVAHLFAKEGANLAINYAASKDRAEALQLDLKSKAPGSKVVLIQGDVSQSKTCADLVEQTVKELGGIDILISNAGWTKAIDWEDLDAFSEEEWDKTFAVSTYSRINENYHGYCADSR